MNETKQKIIELIESIDNMDILTHLYIYVKGLIEIFSK